jgi:hypothetical protein
MARPKSAEDVTTLQMALVGYQIERDRIEAKIRELQAQLKGKRASIGVSNGKPPARRDLSPAARARIAAAQKKRWAEHRRQKALAAKASKTPAAKVQAAG